MSDARQLQSTAAGPFEAILIGVTPHGDERSAPEILEELAELADTGEFVIAGCVAQHRRHPDPNTYLGRGKLDELAELVEQTGAKVVICDDSLSPAQGRNIEQALGTLVLDRSELILHIFAHHARSPQAKLQVELAQLLYQIPRLKRMWTHLERQRGGIGVRGGAGEKQIDLDRSELRARIATCQRQLQVIEGRKAREVRTRADQFTIALVGYTNAGKSTLMNSLTQAGVLAEDRLFSTLDTRTRPWRLPGGRVVLLSDTVGFIRKLPHQLVSSFHATLEEALNADLLFLLVDGSSPHAIDHLHTVEEVLESLGAGNLPRIYVVNKRDRIDDMSLLTPLHRHGGTSVLVSARTGAGLGDLTDTLVGYLGRIEREVELVVPHDAGHLQPEIRSGTTVLREEYREDGCHLHVQLTDAMLARLLARGARQKT
ncbi:MAG: GTPase HflX [Planctomycetes bacterium]|nr:GTPase HflX [Planctomycetota bacterium]